MNHKRGIFHPNEEQASKKPKNENDPNYDPDLDFGDEKSQGHKEISHATIEELGKQLNKAEEKLNSYEEDILRYKAEMQNIQRRAERSIQDAYKYNLEKFVKELIPVLDSIQTGLSIPVQDESAKNVHRGMEMTLDVLLKALKKFGVKEIDPLNEPFNPEFHQALSSKEAEGVKTNTVVEVLQKGYSLNDRLLRPAMVIVAK